MDTITTHYSSWQPSSLLYTAVKYNVDPLIQHLCYEITRIQLESPSATLLPELVSMLQPYRQRHHVKTVLHFWSISP